MKTAVYLNFKYNAKQAIDYYAMALNAGVVCEYTHNETSTQNAELIGKIFHAELVVGDLNLYFCDTGIEPNFDAIKFVVEIKEELNAKDVFAKLTKNGQVISDFQKMPFGPTIAHGIDPFGIRWDVVIC